PSPQEHGGRGVWGEFRRVLAKDRGQSRHLAIHCKTPQKNTLFIRRKKIQRAQNEKSKEYFSVVWRACRAVAGLASLVGGLLKESSNISQKTPPA
ncbi:MAG: hypothetical protein Q7R60_02965, partial [bacterium]|nr:hypothetical protein [bacterium]